MALPSLGTDPHAHTPTDPGSGFPCGKTEFSELVGSIASDYALKRTIKT